MAYKGEDGYLEIASRLLDEGDYRADRTGVGTRSLFGEQIRFDLREEFPLLTTKKVFFKGVIEELLWFIRGETDSNKLSEKGINIWKGNTSKEFLENKGLYYPEGFIGPGYGFQWRNWGGEYWFTQNEEKAFIPDSSGVDQLAQVVDLLRTDPASRRMVVSAWNATQVPEMALPPCHMFFQFWVHHERQELSCKMYQRSCDWFLGVPFNIASYATLTVLIAKIVGLKPGELIMTFGDYHLYESHIEQMKTQLSREMYDFPKLQINQDIQTLEDIERLTFEDFELQDYKCHPTIKARMAV